MTQPDAAAPRIEARQLRPARKWYVVAGVVALLGIVVGGAVGAAGMTSVLRNLPDIVAEFDSDAPTDVTLTGRRDWTIYAAGGAGQTIGASFATCTVTGAADGRAVAVRSVSYEFTFNRGDRSWVAVGDFAVPADGTYRVGCVGESGRPVHYAVGERPELRGFVTGVVGSLAAVIGLPCLGLFTGGVIGLVVAVRRNSHRARLQAAADRQVVADPPGSG